MGEDDVLDESAGLPSPTPAMQRRSAAHEAGFVLVASLRLGPDWVRRVGRYRGHIRVKTLPGALQEYLSDHESLALVCAIAAGSEAEQALLGERSLLGAERASDAVRILRDRCRAGLEPEQPTSNAYDLGPEVESRIAVRLASARAEAAALVAEHRQGLGLLADAFESCLRPRAAALEGAALRQTIAKALDADAGADPGARGGEGIDPGTRETAGGPRSARPERTAPRAPGRMGSR